MWEFDNFCWEKCGSFELQNSRRHVGGFFWKLKKNYGCVSRNLYFLVQNGIVFEFPGFVGYCVDVLTSGL